MLWGFSPALDLLDEIKQQNSLKGKTEINVLIIGAADSRHVLKTISKVYTHGNNITINFYIMDLLMEFIARQMLLLTIAFEPSNKLGLMEKTHLWMEVYANSLLRATSAEYVVQKSYQLLQMVTNPEYLKQRMPCIILDKLKYKEKDNLENIFRYWTYNDFNIVQNWDIRLRKTLQTRYDSKMGVFDWDYHMKLKDKEKTEVINSIEYKQWRNTGVAFTWLEKEYSVSNPTFAVGILSQGDKILSHGFCGDMEFGPYFTFGIECEDKEMFQKRNGIYRKRSTDIVERNMTRIFHEIETNTGLEFADGDRDMGSIITAVPNLNMDLDPKLNIEIIKNKENYEPISTNHKIIFLPINSLDVYPHKKNYQNFFDLVFFGQGLIDKINENVLKMFKKDSLLILETRMYCFTLNKESMKEFQDKVNQKITSLNFEPVGIFDVSNQSIVRFKLKSC